MSAWQWVGFSFGMLGIFYCLQAMAGVRWRQVRRPEVRWDLETDEPAWPVPPDLDRKA